MLENFKEVVVESPVDVIIRQINQLLSTGQLKAGDRLPSERKLSEKLGVGRTYVRDAIKKLEFYGILKTVPQSGTIVASLSSNGLDRLMGEILKLDTTSFFSLVETRVIIETNAVKLAAQRRTDDDIAELEMRLNAFTEKAMNKVSAVEEDFMFHMKIAETSKNPVLKSLLMILIPDILADYTKYDVCRNTSNKTMAEHQLIFEHIKSGNVDSASVIMQEHLRNVMEYARNHSATK